MAHAIPGDDYGIYKSNQRFGPDSNMRQHNQLQSSLALTECYLIIHLGICCLHVSASSCLNPITLATHRKSSQSLPCKHSLQEEHCWMPALLRSPSALTAITTSFPSADLSSGRGSAKIPQSYRPAGFSLRFCKVMPLSHDRKNHAPYQGIFLS